MYKKVFKRAADVLLSVFALIIFSLPMIVIALAIKIESKGPIIFKQTRLGLRGKEFCMYKFRSMCVGAETMSGGVYSNKSDTRVTRVGKFLRATSADELPQLLNVLKGDMSFIGPRPPLTYHPWAFDKYTEVQKRMFEVRPGITGWAQINGRRAGVDRIFVDLEHIGKTERQRGMNTVQSKHSPEDVKKIKKVLSDAELLVRLNPPSSSKKEIDLAIENGADILMLPYFKSAEDAKNSSIL